MMGRQSAHVRGLVFSSFLLQVYMWYIMHRLIFIISKINFKLYIVPEGKLQALEPLHCCCSPFLPTHSMCTIPLLSPFPDAASWTEEALWCHRNCTVSISGKRASLLFCDIIYSLQNFQIFKYCCFLKFLGMCACSSYCAVKN